MIKRPRTFYQPYAAKPQLNSLQSSLLPVFINNSNGRSQVFKIGGVQPIYTIRYIPYYFRFMPHDATTFTHVIKWNVYKVYTELTVKCFKSPISNAIVLAYIWSCQKVWVSDTHVQIQGCLDTRDTYSGCAQRSNIFAAPIVIRGCSNQRKWPSKSKDIGNVTVRRLTYDFPLALHSRPKYVRMSFSRYQYSPFSYKSLVIFTMFQTLYAHLSKMQSFSLWATVCKTVHPMLLDRCLSVCLSCLWRWCIVAKRLDGSSCYLVWR